MSDQGIKRQIDRINHMNLAELREKFNALFGFEPGQTNIVNLRRRLAYRIQELHFGGLSDNDKEILTRIADGDPMANLQNKAKGMISKLRGTRYQRVWKGKKYEVIVLGDGTFEYDGTVYQSLSAIAREITGTRWNGKLFFGVKCMKRPALQQLLADCEAGLVDIIVVYKIDRLSRSICDLQTSPRNLTNGAHCSSR